MDFNVTKTLRAGAPNVSFQCAGFHCNKSLAPSTQCVLASPFHNKHQEGWFARHTESLVSPTFLPTSIICTIAWPATSNVMSWLMPERVLNVTINEKITLFCYKGATAAGKCFQHCNKNDQKNRRYWLAQEIITP